MSRHAAASTWLVVCLGLVLLVAGSSPPPQQFPTQLSPPVDNAARQLSQPPPSTTPTSQQSKQFPNFLVVLIDDLDLLLNSTHPGIMPLLHKHVRAKGQEFRNFVAAYASCCPSRVSLLTGNLTHNHNVTANYKPYGSWFKFLQDRLDRNYLPGWLQALGYRTYLNGKFLNSFDGAPGTCPSNWTVFQPNTEPRMYSSYDFTVSKDCGPVQTISGQHQVDWLSNRSVEYIQDAIAHQAPFYVQLNPTPPHIDCAGKGCRPPQPADRHVGKFKKTPLFKTPSYGVKGVATWQSMKGQIKDLTELYQRRLESLQSVDEMIDNQVKFLEQQGVLNNTYIIVLSDNGFHIGQHGCAYGKGFSYEEDIRVPFMIRGPGISPGSSSDYHASMIDVAPTIMALAGGSTPDSVDGLPLPLEPLQALYRRRLSLAVAATCPKAPPSLQLPASLTRQLCPVEGWGWQSTDIDGRSYKSVRACTTRNLTSGSVPDPLYPLYGSTGTATCYKYTVWCYGKVELYDLALDPYELNNRASSAPKPLINRLDALMSVLAVCKVHQCQNPYGLLHPDGSVLSFNDAMGSQYDAMYAQLPKFKFMDCKTYWANPAKEIGWLKPS